MTSLKVNRPVEVELGNFAVVAHSTNNGWAPYILIDGTWYEIDGVNEMHEVNEEDEVYSVQFNIDHNGFQVVFEGVKS